MAAGGEEIRSAHARDVSLGARIETLLAIVCHRIFIIILVEYRLGLLGIQMYHGFKRLLNHTDISFAHL